MSSLPKFVTGALGADAPQIREFLPNRNAGSRESEYPILGAALTRSGRTGEVWHELVVTPWQSIVQGVEVYGFMFGGCAWHHVVSDQFIPGTNASSLSQDGTLLLPVRELRDVEPILSVLRGDH